MYSSQDHREVSMMKTLAIEITHEENTLAIGLFKNCAYTGVALDTISKMLELYKISSDGEDDLCANFYTSIRMLEYVGASLPTEDRDWIFTKVGTAY